MNRHFQIADLFELIVDRAPADREALIAGESRQNYLELDARANQLAHYLLAQGVGPGDHIGLYLYNCSEYIEGMLACFKIRAVPINVNYRYVDAELRYIFDNSNMVGLIHGREFAPCIEVVHNECPKLRFLLAVEDGSAADLSAIGAVEYELQLAAHSPERGFGERSGDDLFIVYTGGTTGMPKGVMWPHHALFFGGLGGGAHYHPSGKPIERPEQIVDCLEGFPLRTMPLAPLMHGACWWASCIALTAGHTVVLNPNRSLNGEQVLDIAAREKVNGISLVGDAMAIPILDALQQFPERWDLSNLFVVGSGGAVFSASVQQSYREIFPNIMLMNTFGSSETGFQGADTGVKSDGLGRLERGDHADVVTADGRFVTPGSGEKGFLARSGNTPIGYYNDPEKTAKSFIEVEGKLWVLTGDEASLDGDGTIVVYGRGNNCINSGGEKIYPEEVEQAIKCHPAVYDALVVGVSDDRYGQQVAAVVQIRKAASLSLESLQEECRKHVAGYKIPRQLCLVDEVPRSPSGKPDYVTAKKLAA